MSLFRVCDRRPMSRFIATALLALAMLAAAPLRAEPPEDRPRGPNELRARLLEKFDANGDGRFDAAERRAIAEAAERGEIRLPEAILQRLKGHRQAPRRSRGGMSGDIGEKIRVERDVVYATAGQSELKLDVVVPKQPNAEKLPLIAFIHGGGWRQGDKAGGLRQIAPFVASGDYVGASINYRLSGEAVWPAQIHDCKAAIRWLKANAQEYGIDPRRIAVWGGSAGGHLVSLLGTSGGVAELEGDLGPSGVDSRVTCVVDFCGPTDFTGENRFEAGRRPNAVDQLFGANVEDVPQKAEAASPVTYVDAEDPPFLIVHGTDDPVVPFEQAKRLAGRLKQAGVEVTLVPIEGGGHGVGGPGVHGRVAAFLARHLRGQDVEVSDEPIKRSKR